MAKRKRARKRKAATKKPKRAPSHEAYAGEEAEQPCSSARPKPWAEESGPKSMILPTTVELYRERDWRSESCVHV